ncbi:PD-(D/E)XK nuclease family protein [Chitiniphilus purpureus]|uniref:PD-(D/E)XK nuclease family protein n=1 Tax=Chitiniphilus purpureus TaxID=2981137 RepID=A0ABY6DIB2_9NEIS|nr:PD-(D/E)XK nuclease family protein [Chitiniphilus sp. CD1]UXY14071.1 PD-(D/E)XK nuclease family protein [Chitiniphilus sp. CD1]
MSLPDPPLLTLAELAALPADDTVVVTVNNRLARRLSGELARHAPAGVAAQARVLPLSAWLEALLESALFLPDAPPLPARRLDSFGARLLWADTIRAAETARPLLDERRLAALAEEADALADEWRIGLDAPDAGEETQRFALWRQRYRRQLAKLDADDATGRAEQVLALLTAGGLALPSQLIWAGFRDLSPRQAALWHALAGQGVAQARLADPPVAAAPQRFTALDPQAEWRAAAAWAAEQLTADPQGRYAILAPQLEGVAPFARRVLLQTLGETVPFNVSVARPLCDWPLAHAALGWLSVLTLRTDYRPAQLGAALLAGHCAGDLAEAGERARLDAQWRRRGVLVLSTADWLRELFACPRLSNAWPAAQAALSGRAARCDTWAQRFAAALTALGFPGDRPLDSAAYQVLDAFSALLARFAGLAAPAGTLDAAGAVQLLVRLAQDTPFQPERDPGSRLDVLGLLEAEGERWDGIWLLGLTDEALPAPARPNPLLPLSGLKRAGAPRATPERELDYARALFAALLQCAPQVIVSHAERDGERELRASPLIAALAATEWHPRPAPAVVPLPLDALDDEAGPPLGERDQVAGGTQILEAQAKNPLWAFARYRLGATALPRHAEQVAPPVRGRFLHGVLEQVWRMLGDQAALLAARADGSLPTLIATAVAEAARQTLGELPAAVRELEIARAGQVAADWLALEAARLPFAVTALEAPHSWRRGPLTLKLRLDRLDTLPGGGAVIVDYKTGNVLDTAGWGRARPTNLQLPLYAAVLGEGVQGLLLARLNAREVAAKGLAAEALGLPGVLLPDALGAGNPLAGLAWDGILARWRSSIETLADEFAAGHAVNVSQGAGDLEFCDVLPFLRITLDREESEA